MASHSIALARLNARRAAVGHSKDAALDMKALKNPAVYIPGIAAAALGANVLYDSVRAIGLSRSQRVLARAVSGIGYETVESAKYVNGIDPTIIVVDSVEKAKAMVRNELIPFIEEQSGQKLDISDDEVGRVAADIYKSSTRNNAAALPGVRNAYLLVSQKLPQAILDHEIGHIWDFRSKGLNIRDPGPYKHVFHQIFWKPTYQAKVYLAETNAWDLAPESKHIKELEHHALGTYDKGFHANRRSWVVPIGAILAGVAIAGYSDSKEKK